MKERMGKLEFILMKNVYSVKDLMKRMKEMPQS